MVELFEINSEGLIEYSPEALAIKEFKELYDRDTTIEKKKAWLDLTAAFFIGSVSTKNIYKGDAKDARIEAVSKDILSCNASDILSDIQLMEAVGKIIDIEEKSMMKGLLRSGIKHIHKLRNFLDSANLDERDINNKFIHDITKHQNTLTKLTEVAKNLRALEKEVKKEEEGEETRFRGGGVDELDI